MNSLTRWNPFQEMMTLTNQFDRLFENAFPVSRSFFGSQPRLWSAQDWPSQPRIWGLDVDVRETNDAYVIQASVPGFAAEQIDVTLDRNVLTIKGELEEENVDEHEVYHLRERRFGRFSRNLSLPGDVVAEEIQAKVQNGVLTVTIPKHEASKPRQIPVQTGQKLVGSGQQDVIEGETA